ncbi:MAG: TIGR02452 family protein [Candidatus Muirbacterium halophilum]|nr:TIGR02452 family protein [Candidatus Muirbacterium halophilum]
MDEAVYTKDALFIKDKYYQPMEPVMLDVVTVSAVNLNGLRRPANYTEIMRDKILLMMSLAKRNNCDNIILGAWGCGVYKNDPEEVANLFKEWAIVDFDNIVYAVINDHNSVDNNYKIFKTILDER